MTLTTLHISPSQQGDNFFTAPSPVLAGDSQSLICHNLRQRAEGVLEYAAPPASIATVGGTPLIADARDNGYFMLRQEDDSSIIIDGFLDMRDNSYSVLNINLGETGRTVTDAQAVGQFVVLLFDDGTLGYILYNTSTRAYTLLGGLPTMPDIKARPTEPTELTERVEAVTFPSPLADLRAGIPAAAKARIGKSLGETWQRLRRRAADNGLWLQPIEVRFAYRLADGALLHVSEPQRIESDWQCGGRVTLLPTTDSDGKTDGTAAGTMTAEGYRLIVEPAAIDVGVWAKVLSAIEIWVSEESDPVDAEGLPVVGASTVGSAIHILAQLSMRPESSLEAALSAAPCGRLISCVPGATFGVLSPNRDILYNLDAPVAASEEVPRGNVCRILGHDGFLHIATADGLSTCSRGNPLHLHSTTPGDWSDTRAMTAQIWGGGTYTRQIIYIAGDHGVSALAHDAEGRHTNCRTICRRFPYDERQIAAADNCVYMLLDDGSLTRFSGTRAETMVSNIKGCAALFFSRRYRELILMPENPSGHCVAFGMSGLNDVHTADACDALPLPGSDRLLMRRHDNGLTEILSPATEDVETQPALCRWLGRTDMPTADSLWRILSCGLAGEKVDATLRFGQANPSPDRLSSPLTLTEMHIKGEPQGLLRFNIRPGATQHGVLATKGEWHTEIIGRMRSLYHLSLQSPNQLKSSRKYAVNQ